MKKILYLLPLVLGAQSVFADTRLTITRTMNGIAHENNQFRFEISGDAVQVEHPFGHKLHGQTLTYQTQSVDVDAFMDQVEAELSQADLKQQRKVSEARSDVPLFYTSENDDFLVQIWDNDALVWSLDFNDWQYLQFQYPKLSPDWQFLIDGMLAVFKEHNQKARAAIAEVSHD